MHGNGDVSRIRCIRQLLERDLWSGGADLYSTGWRGIPTKGGFFCFWFYYYFIYYFRYLAILVLPSPFSARRRPQCLIDICLGAIGVVGTVEDRAEVGMAEDRAERRLNIRNKSLMVR